MSKKKYEIPDPEPMDMMGRAYKMAKEMGLDLNMVKRPGICMLTVFFDPDPELVKWIADYKGEGRLLVDVGCGSATVLKRLYMQGCRRICGIEPHWDYQESLNWRRTHDDILQVMNYFIEEPACNELLTVENALYLLCRPSHGQWCEYLAEVMHPSSEILLIQKPDTFEKFHDLGKYKSQLMPVEFSGSSKDGERIWSFKKSS